MLKPLHPMPRLAGAGKLVRFVREFHHYRRYFAKLEGAKHLLAARARRCPRVLLTENEHERRFDIVDVSERRARFEVAFGIVKRRRLKPGGLEKSEVGCVPPICPVCDVAL